jgi:YD repeat-containing protein
VETTYDLRGNAIEKSYYLANDSPTRPVARVESEYNELGWKTVDLYYGPAGKRALLRGNGQNQTVYKYDELGNLRELRYLDGQGRPTRGYAADFDDSWRLCGRWVAQYGADGTLDGKGVCLSGLTHSG